MASIDVIVPCYRYGRFLETCVSSVLEQDGPGVRVLILDDASPDDTPEVARSLVKRDGRVSYIRHTENRGHIATYNEGLDWARSDYTLLLSADDWVLPGALARAVAVMEADANVGFVHGNALELYEDEELPAISEQDRSCVIQSGEEFLRECAHANPVVTCTAVVRTALQKRVGGYRPELPHAGDLEMWMRFAAHAAVGRLNSNQGVYRRHRRNMSLDYSVNPLLDLRQREAAIKCFLRSEGAFLSDPVGVDRMLRRGLAEAAVRCATSGHDHFEETLGFAKRLDPTIRHSAGWKKQHLKRFLGPRICTHLADLRCRYQRIAGGA